MGTIHISVLILIGLNALVSFKGFNDQGFFDKFKFHVGAIQSGEYYRAVTSGFLHADISHLLFNMVTLYFFSPFVIAYIGAYNFILIYLASLVLGSMFSYYFHKKEYHYSAIGASGAVTGVLFSAILFEPMMQINFIIPGWIFGVGYLFYSIYGMKKRLGNIGHTAHFGGAIGGYILTLLLGTSYVLQTPLTTVLIGLPIVVLFILLKLKKL